MLELRPSTPSHHPVTQRSAYVIKLTEKQEEAKKQAEVKHTSKEKEADEGRNVRKAKMEVQKDAKLKSEQSARNRQNLERQG